MIGWVTAFFLCFIGLRREFFVGFFCFVKCKSFVWCRCYFYFFLVVVVLSVKNNNRYLFYVIYIL